MRLLVNKVRIKISTARCGATPNHTRVPELPKRICGRIDPSSGSDSFVAVRNVRRLSSFKQKVQFFESIEKQITFAPVSVTKRQFFVSRTVTFVLYDKQNSYVGLTIKIDVGKFYCEGNWFNSITVAPRGQARQNCIVNGTVRKRENSRWCELSGSRTVILLEIFPLI